MGFIIIFMVFIIIFRVRSLRSTGGSESFHWLALFDLEKRPIEARRSLKLCDPAETNIKIEILRYYSEISIIRTSVIGTLRYYDFCYLHFFTFL